MTTGPKKGFYYYLMVAFSVIGAPITFLALYYLQSDMVNGLLFENISKNISGLAIIMIEFILISEVMKHNEGYTTVTTTKYNLYKCRERGKDETFMMFADSEEELEQFFEITQPDKQFFIENASMEGKSISMKIFNTAV